MTDHQERLTSAYHAINAVLEQGIIPFWLERAWDEVHGGFRTNFDENGQALPTPEKYLNTQARLVWWFATLYRQYPERAVFKRLAADGATWMIDHFWDTEHTVRGQRACHPSPSGQGAMNCATIWSCNAPSGMPHPDTEE